MEALSKLYRRDIEAFSKMRLQKCALINDVAATAFTVVGLDALQITGTASNAVASDGNWLQWATTTSINTLAGIQSSSGSNVTRSEFLPRFFARIKTGGSVSNINIAIGLTSTTGSSGLVNAGSENALDLAQLFYSVDTHGSANWFSVTNDGGASGTENDTGVALSADSAHSILIELKASSVDFWIDGNLVQSHSSDLPRAGTNLGFEIMIKNRGTTPAKSIRSGGFIIEETLGLVA